MRGHHAADTDVAKWPAAFTLRLSSHSCGQAQRKSGLARTEVIGNVLPT
jgi:hypothetical protein